MRNVPADPAAAAGVLSVDGAASGWAAAMSCATSGSASAPVSLSA